MVPPPAAVAPSFPCQRIRMSRLAFEVFKTPPGFAGLLQTKAINQIQSTCGSTRRSDAAGIAGK